MLLKYITTYISRMESRGHYVVYSCEIILNLDQWFRICLLKNFLFLALLAISFGGGEPFVQFGLRALWETFM